MKNWKCAIVAVVVLAFAGGAWAVPSIGVYFDEAGTSTSQTIEPAPVMGHGYVLIKDAEMLVGGAAFSIDIDPQISYLWHQVPNLGLYFGDLAGMEIGLYEFIPVFEDGGALLGTFDFYATGSVVHAPITVSEHPNYAAPIVADNMGTQSEAEGLTTYLTIHSTPTVGVYFDEAGTEQHLSTNGGFGVTHTAYVMVREADMVVGGATFKLELDPLIMLGTATPVDALVLGSLTSGVEMGLYSYMPVFDTDAGLLYTIDLITFDNLMLEAPLVVTNHPNYDDVIVADSGAYQWVSEGLTSTLTIVVPTDERSWGDVKSLYQ
ncbi:hypothetical protein H8E07_02325 [bacterium]|nr:hypothetical protein [bacterium]